MKSDDLDRAAAIARALGHPARLRILAMLRSGELCVCQLTAVLGLATSTVSAHLRELRLAGLVRERKEGRFVHFALASDGAASSWITCALADVVASRQVAEDVDTAAALRLVPVDVFCRLDADDVRATLDRGAAMPRPADPPEASHR